MDSLAKVLRFFGHGLGLPSQYAFVKRLGQGAQGDVWLAVDSDTGKMVAVKLMPRGPPSWRLIMIGREARMMARLGNGHVNIVRPIEVVLTGRYVAFIIEYVRGGSVSDFLRKHRVNEDLARYLFRQLLDAIAYCHTHKVAYRDVKPANCMLTGPGWPPVLKLADFGLSETWDGREDPVFQTLAGTPGYMPPEITRGFFDPDTPAAYDGTKADIYSAGVMLCVLLLRHMPWEYDRFAARLPPLEAMRQLWKLEGQEGKTWREATSKVERLSEPLKDLLDGMLEPDEERRMTLEQVRAHPWVAQPLPEELEAVLEALRERQALYEAADPEDEPQIAQRIKLAEDVAKRAEKVVPGLAGFKMELRVRLTPPRPTLPPTRVGSGLAPHAAAAVAAAAEAEAPAAADAAATAEAAALARAAEEARAKALSTAGSITEEAVGEAEAPTAAGEGGSSR